MSKEHRELMTSYCELVKAHTELAKSYADAMSAAPPQAPAAAKQAPKDASAKATVAAPASDANPKMVPRHESRKLVVSNAALPAPPSQPTLMDNTLLFLPEMAVKELGIEANMDDKGEDEKELWFGRVWQLRSLLMVDYEERLKPILAKQCELSRESKRALAAKLQDPFLKARLVKMQARWRGVAFRRRCGLSVLEKLRFCNLRGTLVYAHGSGGCSWDNMRICRMISKMGFLVVCPDDFAYPAGTAMGELRHKDLQPLHLAEDNVDYWAGDLIYSSKSKGTATYCTDPDKVPEDPDS